MWHKSSFQMHQRKKKWDFENKNDENLFAYNANMTQGDIKFSWIIFYRLGVLWGWLKILQCVLFEIYI